MKFLCLEKEHINEFYTPEKVIRLIIRIDQSNLVTVAPRLLTFTHENIGDMLLIKDVFYLFAPSRIAEKTILRIHQNRDLLVFWKFLYGLTNLVKTIISGEKKLH